MTEQNKPQTTQQATSAQPPVQPSATMVKKNKKINQMDPKEIDERLDMAKEKMGRTDSRYAKELLKRKDALINKK